MAYIGRDIEYGSFTKQTLTANSSDVSFVLDQSVLDAKSLLVSVGGVIQEPDVAYTASGTTLTFTGTPTTGDPIWIVYLGKTLGLSSTREAITYQAATGDGSATTVAMTSTGTTGTIIVTLNGVMQTPSTDFSVSGSTLTFTTAPFNNAAIGIHYLGKQAKLAVPAANSIAAGDLASSGTLPAWDGSTLTGIVSVMKSDILEMQNNIALLNFLRSNDHTTKRLSMLNGFNDMFRNTTGVVGEDVSVPMTKFDGTNDQLLRGADLTGIADGLEGTFSGWVNFTGNDSTLQIFLESEGGYVQVYKTAANKISVFISRIGGGGTKVWSCTSTGTYTASSGIFHIASSWNGTTGTLYINGVDALDGTQTSNTGTNADYTRTNWSIGRDNTGNYKSKIEMGQIYFDTSYIDLTVAANRQKFYNSGPVDFGANGSTPTGSQPLIYLNNQADTFQTNLGSGGNFTEVGEIVDGGYVTDKLYSSNSFTNAYELVDSNGKERRTFWSTQYAGSNEEFGYAFTLASATLCTGITIPLRKGGSPTGNVTFRIYGTTGTVGSSGKPDGNVIAISDNVLDAATLSTGADQLISFTFSKPVQLSAATDYCLALFYEGGTGSNYIMWARSSTVPLHGGNDFGAPALGGTYEIQASHNAIFYLYGHKNLDLITKGTDSLVEVDSPSSAPTKGHLEVIMDDSVSNMQSQELPTNSAYGVGYNAASNRLAQGFKLPINGTVPSVELYGKNSGATNADSINVRIETDSGGNPSGTLAHASGAKTAVLQNNNTYQTVTFDSPLSLSANTQYWIVLSANGTTSSSKHFVWATFYPKRYDNGGFRQGTSSAWSTPNTANSFLFRVNVDERTYTTINTDIIGEISRDGGTTYSPAVLSRIPKVINGSTYDILAGDVDFTGDPSGTNLVGRIRTVNKDKVTVNGIAVNWI